MLLAFLLLYILASICFIMLLSVSEVFMAGSSFGTLFRITTWGESHGTGVGVVVDGVPAGLPLSADDIQPFLDRRRPGKNRFSTQRSEEDRAEILSGIFEGRTTGTPVSMIIYNKDHRSADYSEIANYYRPGHADLTYDQKYGFRDYRGGGRSSGRETIGRTAAGAIASRILDQLGVHLCSYVSSIGPVCCDPHRFDPEYLSGSVLCMPDPAAELEAQAYLDRCAAEKTSSGGMVTCRIYGMPAGIGEPVFDKLDAVLSHALFSIGAVKAVEIGCGREAAFLKGHENNDTYQVSSSGKAEKKTNHAGGILGGISDGSDIEIRVAFKPTPSIAREQEALYRDGSVRTVSIRGRHDPVIAARAAVVVECMAAVTLTDLLMQNMSSTMKGMQAFYSRAGRPDTKD